MEYKEKYDFWLKDDFFDKETKEELQNIKDQDKEIEDRFYKDLEFGTGGLRGVIGAGTNRMNIYTVSKATQGLANYILKQEDNGKEMGVCIAYDSRRFSPLFAKTAALVLNGNGIKAYLFDSLHPTPVLSFAVRQLKAISGIVITASHNPKEYNGYKVYWSDGGQVPYPRDSEIIDEVNKVSDFKTIKNMEEKEAKAKGLLKTIGSEIDTLYLDKVLEQSINKDIAKKLTNDLKIVYTPLNGSGNIPVRAALERLGFNNINIVKEQELPDTEFTTVGYPNPEDPKAFKLALELADKVNADVILATDPDCDRVGTVVKNDNGEYVILTGNMIGVLLTEYIISERKLNNTLPKNATIISTIVSTNMTKSITNKNNIYYFDVLTGFKYIGEKIKEFEQSKRYDFVFGFEESYGCLAGTYARDKDAVVASMLICEMAAFYKLKGINLYEALLKLYEKYGFYKEQIESITLKGIDGIKDMARIMDSLRKTPPKNLNQIKVISVRDYKIGEELDLITNKIEKLKMPISDVLYYTLEDESWFCIRPSGTEPKIKIYFGVKGISLTDANDKIELFKNSIMKMIKCL